MVRQEERPLKGWNGMLGAMEIRVLSTRVCWQVGRAPPRSQLGIGGVTLRPTASRPPGATRRDAGTPNPTYGPLLGQHRSAGPQGVHRDRVHHHRARRAERVGHGGVLASPPAHPRHLPDKARCSDPGVQTRIFGGGAGVVAAAMAPRPAQKPPCALGVGPAPVHHIRRGERVPLPPPQAALLPQRRGMRGSPRRATHRQRPRRRAGKRSQTRPARRRCACHA